jgi:chromosome segregation ATPase
MQHQRKHEISACIKSVGSAVCPEHLLEIEQAYKTAQVKKKAVTEELDAKKQAFAERSEYLHRLKTNALVAGREVPLLRSELLKLKEEIFSLTFETERWGKTCTQQEGKIAALECKKRKLEKAFAVLEEKARLVSQEIVQIKDDLHLFSATLDTFSGHKDELAVFQGLELLPGETVGLAEQTPSQIIVSLKAMAGEIELVRAETETFDSSAKVLESTIARQKSEIDIARSRVDTLQGERAGLQEAIDLLLAARTQHQQEIEVLTDGYQLYSQILAESQAVEDQHQRLVTQVNQANTYLKEALLANNRLELSLRLENFKINLLFQEMEQLL